MADLSKLNVLVADDMNMMRALIAQVLKSLGITNVTLTRDGAEAYEKLTAALTSNKPIDFILSDWNMPVMDGLAFLKKVRENKHTAKLPFFVISARAEGSDTKLALDAGATGYVEKPFSATQLVAALKNVKGLVS